MRRASRRSTAARSTRTARAGTARRRWPVAPAVPVAKTSPCGMPSSPLASHSVLPPLTNPGFSISHEPGTAWPWVSTTPSGSRTGAGGDGRHRFGGAGDVDDDTGLDRARPDRRGVLVAGADDHRAPSRSARVRRRRRAAVCRPPPSRGAPAAASPGQGRPPHTVRCRNHPWRRRTPSSTTRSRRPGRASRERWCSTYDPTGASTAARCQTCGS